MNKLKRGIVFLLVFALLLQGRTLYTVAADRQYRMNIQIIVDGAEAGYIPAFDDNYENNLYLSLKGLAYALRGTEKAFTPAVEKRKIDITAGADDSLQLYVWDEEALNEVGTAKPAPYEMYVDGEERRYYSFILSRGEEYDAFMTPISLAMLFDLDMRVTEGRIEISTAAPYSVSAEEMEESGYLQGVNALIIGDGTTGEIFYQYAQDESFPIASTTKLMTYYIFMDAVSQRKCSLDDIAVISEEAARLSNSSDGVIPMLAGSRVPVQELLYGMLLPSSNECALALAEHAAGSQEAFVAQMNDKAEELGWTNAQFYNCHGLPCYEDQLVPAKVQNRMTAEEMFALASVIMDTYPQVTEFTSAKEYHMDAFNVDVKNTNAVLYNMQNVVGLKTGTTNKAGACLVTCAVAEKDGQSHNLIAVLFGAEGDANRGIVSEMSVRYAMEVFWEKGTDHQGGSGEEDAGIPEDPEKVVKKLIRRMAYR